MDQKIYYQGDFNFEYRIDDLYKLFSDCEIRVDRMKDPYAIVIENEKVVAGLFAVTHFITGNFSFDICVDENYRRKGIATKLVQIALDLYDSLIEMGELELQVNVVGFVMKNLLETKFNFVVLEDYGNQWFMGEST